VEFEIVRTSPEVVAGGYVAQRHRLIAGVIEVESPCGCILSVNAAAQSVLTVCQHEGCAFEWHLAIEALKLLELTEGGHVDTSKGSRDVRDSAQSV
jgi:hypothetical protein